MTKRITAEDLDQFMSQRKSDARATSLGVFLIFCLKKPFEKER